MSFTSAIISAPSPYEHNEIFPLSFLFSFFLVSFILLSFFFFFLCSFSFLINSFPLLSGTNLTQPRPHKTISCRQTVEQIIETIYFIAFQMFGFLFYYMVEQWQAGKKKKLGQPKRNNSVWAKPAKQTNIHPFHANQIKERGEKTQETKQLFNFSVRPQHEWFCFITEPVFARYLHLVTLHVEALNVQLRWPSFK